MELRIGQTVKIKSLEWFDRNSTNYELIEVHFIIDRNHFSEAANKYAEVLDKDSGDDSVFVKYKDDYGVYVHTWLPVRSIESRRRTRKAKVRF